MKFALGHGALAEKTGCYDVIAPHVIGERQPHRERKAATDDCVAAVEVGRPIEEMHGAAAAAAAALLLAEHLGKRRGHRHAAHQGVRMLAVGGDDPIALLKDRNDADGDRLLAIVEMKEAADPSCV